MRMSSVMQELRAQRIKWLRDILEAPEESVQLRAAIGGMMKVGDQRLGGEYAPWLNQMVEDI